MSKVIKEKIRQQIVNRYSSMFSMDKIDEAREEASVFITDDEIPEAFALALKLGTYARGVRREILQLNERQKGFDAF